MGYNFLAYSCKVTAAAGIDHHSITSAAGVFLGTLGVHKQHKMLNIATFSCFRHMSTICAWGAPT
jgi:hypothetical protein